MEAAVEDQEGVEGEVNEGEYNIGEAEGIWRNGEDGRAMERAATLAIRRMAL